uniref:Uncharacterized protein n=1 Tax=Cucumis melo TaxID=3656 RepID=A0A9I9EGG8_CUCME
MVTHTHFKGRTKYRGNDLSHRFDNILPYKKDSRGQHSIAHLGHSIGINILSQLLYDMPHFLIMLCGFSDNPSDEWLCIVNTFSDAPRLLKLCHVLYCKVKDACVAVCDSFIVLKEVSTSPGKVFYDCEFPQLEFKSKMSPLFIKPIPGAKVDVFSSLVKLSPNLKLRLKSVYQGFSKIEKIDKIFTFHRTKPLKDKTYYT